MIRTETAGVPYRSSVNPLKGEFALVVAGEPCRFDTRLSTIAAIEVACGDRPIVEILNGIIVGRRARDVIPLLAAALGATEPAHREPEALAGRASVGEAEAFVLALVFALGFKVGQRAGEGDREVPLDGSSSGGAGASSRSAA